MTFQVKKALAGHENSQNMTFHVKTALKKHTLRAITQKVLHLGSNFKLHMVALDKDYNKAFNIIPKFASFSRQKMQKTAISTNVEHLKWP